MWYNNPMARILIIGCGFAGLSAAQALAGSRRRQEVVVIDRGAYFNFLPMLPDVVGRNVAPRYLTYPIRSLSRTLGFGFLNQQVSRLDLDKKIAYTPESVPYDYLLIASGSETNFYGNDRIKKLAYKLDDAEDARKIRDAVTQGGFTTYIVSGGGYTGVEIATNIKRRLQASRQPGRVVIIERAPSLLGPLPEWMKAYVTANVQKLGIEVFTNSMIDRLDDDGTIVSGKNVFPKAMLIWAAGVRTPDFVQDLKIDKTPQGRLKVDPFLRIAPGCFVAGDSACVAWQAGFLRMAVQFAITQGACAAANIARDIAGKSLVPYRPVDFGYLIPLANNRACGSVLGANLKGVFPLALHYLMCLYRSYGWKNRAGIIKNLLTK
ncbi:MAG TPA: FAD-dependent oxidoreductase [Patescibacteria group bacterium]|nr:FAD-dependent oxidoreductase [Patescibacteria group bacterium]